MVEQSNTSGAHASAASGERERPRSQIRPVDPVSFADEASAILRSAWRPPCLDYTPGYLRFQCGFPTTLDPVSLAMYQGDEAIGFVAATGRHSNIGEMYHSSFLSLRPGSLPSLSIALARHQLRIIQRSNTRMLVFAQVGSTGENLLRCIESIGMKRSHLGEYRVHAAMPRLTTPNARVEELPGEEWAVEAGRMRDDSLLSPAFDAADLRHFVQDPDGRKFLAVIMDGKIIATAMRAYTPTVTATGSERIPALHYVRLAEQQPEALIALLGFAKDASHPVVTVPNAIGISPPVARAAGLRATGSVFAAYLTSDDGDVPPLRGTEFEIV